MRVKVYGTRECPDTRECLATYEEKKLEFDFVDISHLDGLKAFLAIRDTDPAAPEAQALVQKLQSYITEHYYTCSNEILLSLSKMYDGGGTMTESIDKVGGPGTGDFAARAIAVHCKK